MSAVSAIQGTSIKQKLTLIIVGTSVIALLLASCLILTNNYFSARSAKVRSLTMLADVVGSNSVAALTFSDTEDAAEVLSALRAEPSIMAASMHTTGGEIFATYVRAGESVAWPLPTDLGIAVPVGADPQRGQPSLLDVEMGTSAHRFARDRLSLVRPILLRGRPIGVVCLQSDMQTERLGLQRSVVAVGLAAFGASLVAFALSSGLRRIITGPIMHLLETANQVSRHENYAIRAQHSGDDELGALTDGFNEMLVQIQERDEQLLQHRDHLEDQVAARTTEMLAAKEAAVAASQAKSTFLANMSHELRTPLHAVLGFSLLLQEEAKEHGWPAAVTDLEKIRKAAKHLLTLIGQILDLSKIEAGKMTLQRQTTNLGDLVAEAGATARPLIEQSGNTLEIRCGDDLGVVQADSTKIVQCLLNLLGNSARFTENGRVELDVGRHQLGGHEVVRFTVTDTGIGMTEEEMSGIFAPFAQADNSPTRSFGGTGLGLAITKSLCEMMGGGISAESQAGEGSTFSFWIPAIPPA